MIYMCECDTEKMTEVCAHLEEVKAELKDAAEKLEMIGKIMNRNNTVSFEKAKRSQIAQHRSFL